MRVFLCLFLLALAASIGYYVLYKKDLVNSNTASASASMKDPRSFKEIWDLYSSQMKLKNSKVNFRFNAPAQQEELQVFEKAVEQKFSADIIQLYTLGNGQAEDGFEVFTGFTLMSTAEAAKVWQQMENNHKGSKVPVMPDGPVRKVFWNSKWIPIAADAGGNLLCADFDPASGGIAGQLVAVYLDDVVRKAVASSIKDYFAKTAAGLRSGTMGFDDFGTGPYTNEELKKFKENQ